MSLLIEAVGRLADLSESAANFFQKRLEAKDPTVTTYKTIDDLHIEQTKHIKTGRLNLNITSYKEGRTTLFALEVFPATDKKPQKITYRTMQQYGRAMVTRDLLTPEDAQRLVDALLPRLT